MKEPSRIKKYTKMLNEIDEILNYYMQGKEYERIHGNILKIQEFLKWLSMHNKVHDIKLWEKFKKRGEKK